jgi:hypothetical protein
MMAPQHIEQLVYSRQEQFLSEAAAERLSADARSLAPGVRQKLARSLYGLAAWLSVGVVEARSGSAGIRSVATCAGVEYWRPAAMPLRR